jgi:hypothetical protein
MLPWSCGILPFFRHIRATVSSLATFSSRCPPDISSSLARTGFHRVYRRLAEANRRIIKDPSDRRLVQSNLKEAFRFPNRFVGGGKCSVRGPVAVDHTGIQMLISDVKPLPGGIH